MQPSGLRTSEILTWRESSLQNLVHSIHDGDKQVYLGLARAVPIDCGPLSGQRNIRDVLESLNYREGCGRRVCGKRMKGMGR